MRIILILALIGSSVICFAQDEDFTDYRRKTENFSRIYDKDIRSDLASFTIGGIEESLNKTPLKKLPVVQYSGNSITYDSNQIRVIIKSGVFFGSKHKLLYEGKHLVKIDGKPYYGNYGKMPETTIAEVMAIIGSDTVRVPPNAFADLYNPSFTYSDASGITRSQDGVYLSADKRKIYIYMLNKDNAGSYEVTWIIQDKNYLRRVVDYDFSK